MKSVAKFFLLAVVAFFCINLGTSGEYARNKGVDQPPYFTLKKGRESIRGVFRDEKKEKFVTDLCFYNPTDDECRAEGKPVGEVYLEAFEKDGDCRSKVYLKDIESIEIVSVEGSRFFISERHKDRKFLRVYIRFVSGVEDERLIDPQIAVGFYNPKTREHVNVFLYKIDKIEGIGVDVSLEPTLPTPEAEKYRPDGQESVAPFIQGR